MNFLVKGATIKFTGRLTESTDFRVIMGAIVTASQVPGKDRVRLDFEDVTHANSAGIFGWIRMINTVTVPVSYYRVRSWMVESWNMIPDFFKVDVLVESIEAHYYDASSDLNFSSFLVLGKDVPFLKSYASYEISDREVSGTIARPDFDPAYFAFISTHYELLSRFVPPKD